MLMKLYVRTMIILCGAGLPFLLPVVFLYEWAKSWEHPGPLFRDYREAVRELYRADLPRAWRDA